MVLNAQKTYFFKRLRTLLACAAIFLLLFGCAGPSAQPDAAQAAAAPQASATAAPTPTATPEPTQAPPQSPLRWFG